ncbi:MAG: VapC toxin family PIN domain ribonuclease, partial [Deltaproteobacteria bacterium]|nr:VapC toxin family PIN domain ribonuclease [Deltaproteobacteria bacterium]
MALAVDTNIFIYAHFEEFAEHRATRTFLEGLLKRPDPYYLSWQVAYEYMRLVTHP